MHAVHAHASFGGKSVIDALYSAKESIVEVRADDLARAGGGRVIRSVRKGAGVILDNSGSVLTNSHIVSGASRITVRLHDGTELKVISGVVSRVFDLAIVRIEPSGGLVPIVLSENTPELGDNVYSVGSSFWRKGAILSGHITAAAIERSVGGEQLLIRSTIRMDRGDSGAPLLDRDGNLAGLIFGKMAAGKGTVALPVNVIKNFYLAYEERFLSQSSDPQPEKIKEKKS